MKRKIYLIVSIDTECDKGPGWKIPRPMGFTNIIQGVPEVLQPVFGKYEIKPTYLLSPEIMHHRESAELFSKLAGVELGTHLHIEFIEPDVQAEADRTKGIQRQLSRDGEAQKLTNLTNLFKEKFGYAPLSFRAGRFGISQHSFSLLDELGYKVDSSVTPFKTHYYENGMVNNFWGKPVQPYRLTNYELLQVPVSIYNKDFFNLPAWVLSLLEDKRTLVRKIMGKAGFRSKSEWFRPYRSSAAKLSQIADALVAATRREEVPVLNMMFHSNEILPGTSPYCQTQEEVDVYMASLSSLFEYLHSQYTVCSTGLGEYAGYFR